MKTLSNILLLLLALLIQTSWVSKIGILGLKPDVVLIVLAYIGISRGQIEGTLYGFASGFLLDVFDPDAMGINALSNSVVGFAVGYTRIGIVAEDLRVKALLLFMTVLLHDLVFFTFASLPNVSVVPIRLIQVGVGTALYTTVLGICLSLLLSIRFNKGIYLDARRLHG